MYPVRIDAPRPVRALLGLMLASAAMLCSPPSGAGMPTEVYVNAAGTCDYPTLQAAVDDLAPGSEIRLVGPSFQLSGSLNLFNRQLVIAGGYAACGAPAPEGTTLLQAAFAGAPVISAGGNLPGALDLTLRDLVLAGADNPTGNGGGLLVTGQGQVNLVGVEVRDNLAGSGGGLYVAEIGGSLDVNLLGGSRIGTEDGAGNGAHFGGGVYCSQARMRLGHADIMSNAASQNGGGLFADGCQILSTEQVGDLRIEGNRARRGGGIYATGASELVLRSRLQQKVSISHNEASVGAAPQSGGGIYLIGFGTTLSGEGLRIDNNIARGFAAGLIVVGASATLSRGSNSCALGDIACSSLSGNQVRDAMGALTGSTAAAFVAGGGSPQLSLQQTRMVGNAAGGSILAVGDAGVLELSSVLIAGNQTQGGLLSVSSSGALRGDLLTIADNLFPSAALLNNSSASPGVRLDRSILLVEPGSAHLSGGGSSEFSCLNTGAGGALGGSAHPPGFANAASGDYRLAADSQNLDQCADGDIASPFDIGGYPRVIDRPDSANAAGAVDRGAFEDIDQLLQDGFEG